MSLRTVVLLAGCLLLPACDGASVVSSGDLTSPVSQGFVLGRDGRSLLLSVTTGGPCQGRGVASGSVRESSVAVLVDVRVVGGDRVVPDGTVCPLSSFGEQLELPLSRPLGPRVVLDARRGTALVLLARAEDDD